MEARIIKKGRGLIFPGDLATDSATRPKRTAMQGAQPPATKKKYRERAAAIRTLQEEFRLLNKNKNLR